MYFSAIKGWWSIKECQRVLCVSWLRALSRGDIGAASGFLPKATTLHWVYTLYSTQTKIFFFMAYLFDK